MASPITAIPPEVLTSSAPLAVLSALWNNGPVSRSDLAVVTGLAPSSVTRATRQLQQAGLIRELEAGPSTGGRPPMLLTVSDETGMVIGVDLSGLSIRAALMTATGRQLTLIERPFEGVGKDLIQTQLEEMIKLILAVAAEHAGRVLAVGVSVPGTVEQSTGTIVDVTNLSLKDYRVGEALQRRFGYPVFIEHDTAAAAYAEKQFGAGTGLGSLIFVTVASGIGAGLVLNERIYRGEAGGAGELGHIVVEPNGPKCLCGKRGCLEAVASVPALIASAQRKAEGSPTGLLARSAAEAGALTPEILMSAAERGDDDARGLVEGVARHLAHAIGTTTCLLDIRTVIVGGEAAFQEDRFLELVRDALPDFQLYSNPVNVVPAQLGQDAALRGVSTLAFRFALNLDGSSQLVDQDGCAPTIG